MTNKEYLDADALTEMPAFPTADLEAGDDEAIREATVQVVHLNEHRRIDRLLRDIARMNWKVLATHGATLLPYFDAFCDVGRTHLLGFEMDQLRERTSDFVLYITAMTSDHAIPGQRERNGSIIRFAWRWKPYPNDYARGTFVSCPPSTHEYVLWSQDDLLLERMNNFRGL